MQQTLPYSNYRHVQNLNAIRSCQAREELGVRWAKVLFESKVTYIRALSRSTTPGGKH